MEVPLLFIKSENRHADNFIIEFHKKYGPFFEQSFNTDIYQE